MLTIRLQRTGRKNAPDFRIVLAEKHRSATKKILEIFGEYNPRTKQFQLRDEAGLLKWVKRGVELSPTVRNLLIARKLIDGKKVKAWRPKVKEKPAVPAASAVPAAAEAASAEAQTPESPKEEAK
jgi:small subunit ribosomal protein S16